MISSLHLERLDAAHAALRQAKARTVLDLGCGPGPLFRRLAADSAFERLVGVERDRRALDALRAALSSTPPASGRPAFELINACITALDERYAGFDAAILIETIEHMTLGELARIEETVFARLAPATVIVTTPNSEFNHLLGVPARRMRHPGHRFEWTRSEFRQWGERSAARYSYRVAFENVGGDHPAYGGPTQLARFARDAA